MKLDVLLNMLEVLPLHPAEALAVQEVCDRYYRRFPPAADLRPESLRTNIRRYLRAMQVDRLVFVVEDGRTRSEPGYYIRAASIPSHFMNSKVALGLLWSRRLLAPLVPALADAEPAQLADAASLSESERTLLRRVRIVPDGIGRLDAAIDPGHLRSAADALQGGHMIELRYDSRSGGPQLHRLSVLGLAAKDGTIYLVGTTGMEAAPRHYALHRVRRVELLKERADLRPDFDIDDYVAQHHQFSHKLEAASLPIRLELLVHRDALFHFIERPLMGQDPIEEAALSMEGAWVPVTATIPDTVQLAPFLWSHAGWVRVEGPPAIRKRVSEGLRAAALHYPEGPV